MISKRFILEIADYEPIDLGLTEMKFLEIFWNCDESAYGIFLTLRKGKPMAYKNVHRRVKRLETLGLIKEESLDTKHKAKIYTLTSRGIFQVLIMDRLHSVHLLNARRNDIILETILYQFFNNETIGYFNTLARTRVLSDYLGKCCYRLQVTVKAFHSSPSKVKYHYFATVVQEIIKTELRNFVLQIITLRQFPVWEFGWIDFNKPDYSEWGKEGERIDKNDPDYLEIFPKPSLMKDNKFMKVLSELKAEFDNGSRDYLV